MRRVQGSIDNLGGWLTTVVARVCLDMLRSRQSRREEPFTPDAPEPVATGIRGSSPEQEALLADSVGLALLAASGSGDRTPTPREQDLCSLWREWELRLIRPQLILVVGGLSARRLLGVTALGESIGRRHELDGATAIPLPHPSGTSRWLNDPGNRERLAGALDVVRQELSRLRTAPPRSIP